MGRVIMTLPPSRRIAVTLSGDRPSSTHATIADSASCSASWGSDSLLRYACPKSVAPAPLSQCPMPGTTNR